MSNPTDGPARRLPRHIRLEPGVRRSTATAGRTCAHPDCTTRLSRYNHAVRCGTHGGWVDPESEAVDRRPLGSRRPWNEMRKGPPRTEATTNATRRDAARLGDETSHQVVIELSWSGDTTTRAGEALAELLGDPGLDVRPTAAAIVVRGHVAVALSAVRRTHSRLVGQGMRPVMHLRIQHATAVGEA